MPCSFMLKRALAVWGFVFVCPDAGAQPPDILRR